MSSPEFSDLRGINGKAVAAKCGTLGSAAERQLLWFIQGVSLTEGGLDRMVDALLKMFPDRVQIPPLQDLGGSLDARQLLDEPIEDSGDVEPAAPLLSVEDLHEKCLAQAREGLPEFLTRLCIDPALSLERGGHTWESTMYLKDIVGALFEYQRRHNAQANEQFCQTAISRRIWEQLDYALRSKSMIVIDGREGRGKTEAVRAWCNCHLGVARFVSLVGTNTKTSHFTEMAKALGVGNGISFKVSQMQYNVQDVLRASQLMLVIDEAHYFFNQAPRMKTRPEMLDWIDSALCNPPLPIALVTTPQFMICMERAAGQVGWNYRQFKRRCKRYCRLPAKNTPEDTEAVALKLLPGADRATIKQIMAYEALSKRDLSAVGDVAREAKLLAEEDGAHRVTFEHVKRAIHEVLIVSDVPWAEMERRLQHQKVGHKASRIAPEDAMEAIQEPSEPARREISPRILPAMTANRLVRSGGPVAVLAGD